VMRRSSRHRWCNGRRPGRSIRWPQWASSRDDRGIAAQAVALMSREGRPGWAVAEHPQLQQRCHSDADLVPLRGGCRFHECCRFRAELVRRLRWPVRWEPRTEGLPMARPATWCRRRTRTATADGADRAMASPWSEMPPVVPRDRNAARGRIAPGRQVGSGTANQRRSPRAWRGSSVSCAPAAPAQARPGGFARRRQPLERFCGSCMARTASRPTPAGLRSAPA
jgi:hypothetical protein